MIGVGRYVSDADRLVASGSEEVDAVAQLYNRSVSSLSVLKTGRVPAGRSRKRNGMSASREQ